MFKKGVCFGSELDSGSVAYRCLKEGGVDCGSVAYSGEEGGYILERWVDFGRVAYLRGGVYSGKAGQILGGRDRSWEHRI